MPIVHSNPCWCSFIKGLGPCFPRFVREMAVLELLCKWSIDVESNVQNFIGAVSLIILMARECTEFNIFQWDDDDFVDFFSLFSIWLEIFVGFFVANQGQRWPEGSCLSDHQASVMNFRPQRHVGGEWGGDRRTHTGHQAFLNRPLYNISKLLPCFSRDG